MTEIKTTEIRSDEDQSYRIVVQETSQLVGLTVERIGDFQRMTIHLNIDACRELVRVLTATELHRQAIAIEEIVHPTPRTQEDQDDKAGNRYWDLGGES